MKEEHGSDQHGKIQPWTTAKVFQEINKEQDQRVVRKLSFCHQGLQRKGKDIALSKVMTWFSFGPHNTSKSCCCLCG